jgi:hypothetical protein
MSKLATSSESINKDGVIDDPFTASCGGFDLRLCKGDTEFIEKLCDLKECVVFYFLGQIFTGHYGRQN